MIVIVFTGGTISMRVDPASGGAVPMLSGNDILAMVPQLGDVAELEVDQFGTFPGPHMTVERMWELRQRLVKHAGRAEVQGIVVTHGTDTLEESAYLVARSFRTSKPIVFTGAMRTSSDLGWDGPANLDAAVRVAASAEAARFGVLVVMSDQVYSALDDTKGHTHMLDAFESPGLGPLGVIDDGRVIFRRALPWPMDVIEAPGLGTPVDIVHAYAGADSRLLDASREAARGVVITALGRGNVPPAMVAGIERWIAAGKPVVITSRAPRGRVGRTYAYDGGGRRLQDAGAILAGSRRPPQARIDVMLALGAGVEVRTLFAT